MSHALEALASGAESILGRPLTASQLDSFGKYLKLLQKWQRAQRLIGSPESRWIVDNVFLDSLLFLRVLPPHIDSVADLGSGAGFPGIPIKIARPGLAVTLIESRERRVSFLSAVIRELGLEGMRVIHERAERIASQMPRSFGAVVLRCAGDLRDLLPLASRLVVPGGLVVASGPPSRRRLSHGQWSEVLGIGPGSTRRFAIVHV